MRGQQLGAMIQMLRRELKIAESPALGRNVREAHAHALRSAQDRIYSAFDWPFKFIYRDIAGQAAQRYYAPPADMSLEDIRDAEVLVVGTWYPICRGIGIDQYNEVNSDANERQDYVRNWALYNDPVTNGDMLEFWPVPAVNNASKVRFHGVRKLSPLVDDADKADLDDNAIVLTAAADLSPVRERAAMQARADRHIYSLFRNLTDSRTFVSGGGCDPIEERFEPPRIVIAQ